MSDNDQHDREPVTANDPTGGTDVPQASAAAPGSAAPSTSPDGIPPFPPYPLWVPNPATTPPARASAGTIRKAVTGRAAGWIVAAAMAGAVIGLSVSLATTPSARPLRPPLSTFGPSRLLPGGGFGFGPGEGYRAGTGGTGGTVDSVSSSSFTMTTTDGSRVTVDEEPSTIFRNGRTAATLTAVVSGDRVLVIGSTSGSTITATEVIVLPAQRFGIGGPPASS